MDEKKKERKKISMTQFVIGGIIIVFLCSYGSISFCLDVFHFILSLF